MSKKKEMHRKPCSTKKTVQLGHPAAQKIAWKRYIGYRNGTRKQLQY
jgi:hypothetical protein